MYLEIKTFHITTVIISVSLYIYRFLRYYISTTNKPQPHWLKYLPHINDTLLFSSGITLIYITKFIPFTDSAPWLSAKLIAVILYIICGFKSMNNSTKRRNRIFFFLASIGWLLVIITLAINKPPSSVFSI